MQNFFWGAFGVFFIVASIMGVLTIISYFYDLIWTRKKLKEIQNHTKTGRADLKAFELSSREIIAICEKRIAENTSPNVFVIQAIKREFESILNSIIKEGKVIVLTKRRDLWACRTIIDSAEFDHDHDLFDKVYAFQKDCKKLPRKNINILYP